MSLFSLGTGLAQAGLSYLGSRESAKAAEKSADIYKDVYRDQRRGYAPYMHLGETATTRLDDLLSGRVPFEGSPEYDFRFEEGRKALENSAAARGMLFSGQTGKALQDYGQQAASQERNVTLNQLMQAAGLGGEAASGAAGAGTNLAINLGGAEARAGEARRSGYEGFGDALGGTAENIVSLEALRRFYPSAEIPWWL